MNRPIFAQGWGIHPPEHKQESLGNPIREASLPAQLVLPLAQHIGAPAEPRVNIGERVLKGQKIAEASGFISAPVHASSSGTVSAISEQPLPHPSGLPGRCIVIDVDGSDEACDWTAMPDWGHRSEAELLEFIRDKGIAGLGGAGFPTAAKLASGTRADIEFLILNGAECEPYITADHALMRERAEQLIYGIEVLSHLLQPREVLLGIEDNKPDAIAAVRAAAGSSSRIQIVVIPTKYPSGGEKQLIQILTGREVPHGGIPADIGVVCVNVGTTTAIAEAVQHGQPLISRVTTLTGAALREPGNYEVRIGTPVAALLVQAGLEQQQLQRLVMGGPMMGFTLTDTSVPVVKISNCILAATAQEAPLPPAEQACIRCGSCAVVCPAYLEPQQLYWYSQAKEFDRAEAEHLFDCIECGACAYVCPSDIPLVQYYRFAKGEIRQAEHERVKAERSRERFEARKDRLAREEAEKEARRRERREAARKAQEAKARAASGDASEADADADPRKAEVEAALERVRQKKAVRQTGEPTSGDQT